MPGIQTTIINKNSGGIEIHGAKPQKEKTNVQVDSVSTPPEPRPPDKTSEPKETIES